MVAIGYSNMRKNFRDKHASLFNDEEVKFFNADFSTIPLFLGAKKFFTTLTQSIGVTTVTDYETMTVSAAQPGSRLPL
jgi:hypothetical protein